MHAEEQKRRGMDKLGIEPKTSSMKQCLLAALRAAGGDANDALYQLSYMPLSASLSLAHILCWLGWLAEIRDSRLSSLSLSLFFSCAPSYFI